MNSQSAATAEDRIRRISSDLVRRSVRKPSPKGDFRVKRVVIYVKNTPVADAHRAVQMGAAERTLQQYTS